MTNTNKIRTLASHLAYVDLIIIVAYIMFSKYTLSTLLYIFESIVPTDIFDGFGFLVWGGTLFIVCATSSYFRGRTISISGPISFGFVAFAIMVFSAIALSINQTLRHSDTINPYWVINLSTMSYLMEIVTTAGAAYLLADALLRIRNFIRKT